MARAICVPAPPPGHPATLIKPRSQHGDRRAVSASGITLWGSAAAPRTSAGHARHVLAPLSSGATRNWGTTLPGEPAERPLTALGHLSGAGPTPGHLAERARLSSGPDSVATVHLAHWGLRQNFALPAFVSSSVDDLQPRAVAAARRGEPSYAFRRAAAPKAHRQPASDTHCPF
ncbi:hypothetical protein PHLGIDRAFT_120319 [Phlebiopsis gigantea 11061_1 CR5-6]|uniref:Uncharacterized protein n=1 Tax=Phlebiopsis gigantea (strain 11061_1 CR5-6) TaxID=745531 RepID=A0A0C3NJ29_PHLG1|nr:hypothetical protein PHLGIDRAFT_120319 [Phlebiopsis gigantea 11061_1 CR5-6]